MMHLHAVTWVAFPVVGNPSLTELGRDCPSTDRIMLEAWFRVEDEQGRFGWGAPEDEEVHSYINQLVSSVGTYLYGRRMYETMLDWETAHTVPNQPQFVLEWARQWQAAEKIVYSRTLAEPRSLRTRIEREFEPDVVQRLKADVRHDITVDGPELAAHALRAGLVDEL
jgi:dihydrofolate reductase